MTNNNELIDKIVCRCIRQVVNEMAVPDTPSDFIRKAHLVHGNRYDYSQLNYSKSKNKVNIICPTHGMFQQRATDHLQGHGCKRCRESHLEKQTDNTLTNMSVNFVHHASPSWLNGQHLDFFLTDYNAAIECQGIQHFQPVPFFGGEERFERQKMLDSIKQEACSNNGILLYYINYNDNDVQNKIQKIIASLKSCKDGMANS